MYQAILEAKTNHNFVIAEVLLYQSNEFEDSRVVRNKLAEILESNEINEFGPGSTMPELKRVIELTYPYGRIDYSILLRYV